MFDLNVFEQAEVLLRYFKDTTLYTQQVHELTAAMHEADASKVAEAMKKLPNCPKLLDTLVEKLKKKSVYKTLKRIAEGRVQGPVEELKGWFSLGTHVMIEMGQGNAEYGLLLGKIYEKIGDLIYKTGDN